MFEEFVEIISSNRDELVCYVATFFEFVNSQSICLLTLLIPFISSYSTVQDAIWKICPSEDGQEEQGASDERGTSVRPKRLINFL